MEIIELFHVTFLLLQNKRSQRILLGKCTRFSLVLTIAINIVQSVGNFYRHMKYASEVKRRPTLWLK